MFRRWLPEGVLVVVTSFIWCKFGVFWGMYATGTWLALSLWRHLIIDNPSTKLRLQSSQQFKIDLESPTLEAKDVYSAAVILTAHSDAMSWQRLYTLLTANSIMMLAWATVYTASSIEPIVRGQIGLCVAIPGVILSAAWAPFGSRNRRLHRRWGNFYAGVERLVHPNGGLVGPGVAGEDVKYLLIEEWCKTGYLIVAVPLLFADAFWFVMLKSLFQCLHR